jgi:hypothetical protein
MLERAQFTAKPLNFQREEIGIDIPRRRLDIAADVRN